MPGIRVDESRILEMVRLRVQERIGLRSKGGSVAAIASDVDRISRSLSVPGDFMDTLRDIAEDRGQYDTAQLRAFLNLQHSDPRWQSLLTFAEDPLQPESVKAAEAPKEPAASKKSPGSEKTKSAPLQGPRADFGERLAILARRVGINPDTSPDAMHLMGRMRRLADANTSIRSALEPFEAELPTPPTRDEVAEAVVAEEAQGPMKSSLLPASPPASQTGDDAAVVTEKRAAVRAAVPQPDIPLCVRNFGFSIYRLDWLDSENLGWIDRNDDTLLMEPYGHAMVGAGRSIDLGALNASGISAFFLKDPVSGVSAAGKMPRVDDMRAASKAIIASQRRLQSGKLKGTGERDRLLELSAKFSKGMTPHDYGIARIAQDFENITIPADRLTAGLVFFAERGGRGRAATPPSQVLQMLGALSAVGVGSVSLAMFHYPEGAEDRMIFDAASNSVMAGAKPILEIGGGSHLNIAELMRHVERFRSAMTKMDLDPASKAFIEKYHLPVAVARFHRELDEMNDALYSLLDEVTERDRKGRRPYLTNSYLRLQLGLPSMDGGKVDRGGGGGGGGAGVGPVMRRELYPTELHALEAGGIPSESSMLSASAAFGFAPPLFMPAIPMPL